MLDRLAILDLDAGRLQDAAAHLREVLQYITRAVDRGELHNALESCGRLCAATGRPAEAVTVWAASAAFLRHQEIPDPPEDARRREEPLRQARQALGTSRTQVAEQRGAAMTLETAAEYALMLTDPGPQPVAQGPGTLSAWERELVALVARGRTDAQIAAELYISIRTRALAPGPDRGQDRLPPPGRPNPSGPQRRPGLTGPAACADPPAE